LEGLQVFFQFFTEKHEMKMNVDFGGKILTELNRRSRVNIYLSGSTKPKWTGLDFFNLYITVHNYS